MYKCLIIALATLGCFLSFSQDLSSTFQLEWTFGEAMISTPLNERRVLTCGFHQSESLYAGTINFEDFIAHSFLRISLENINFLTPTDYLLHRSQHICKHLWLM